MILRVESWTGDTTLSGKSRPRWILEEELFRVDARYDRQEDNFVPLLCRAYGWELCETGEAPDFTYDRDTGRLLPLGKE